MEAEVTGQVDHLALAVQAARLERAVQAGRMERAVQAGRMERVVQAGRVERVDHLVLAELMGRVDTAIALYKAGKVQKLLLSGDNQFVLESEFGLAGAQALLIAEAVQ